MHTVTDYGHTPTDRPQNCDSPILARIAEKVGEKRFALWFGQDTLCQHEPQTENTTERVVFQVRNHFALNSIRRHCSPEIKQAVREICGKDVPIEFAVHSSAVPPCDLPVRQPTLRIVDDTANIPQKDKKPTGRRFASLATYLEGLSNRLACRAADLAINHPGEINPIYIFGPTSVGKTHILEGIWSAVRKKSTRQLPLYMTAENFLSSFVETIRSGSVRDRNQSFRSKFKGISHLLIDDIQFFARAESTQTEFLQVFDMLRNQGVQLVFSGDRPLKDLTLRSELLCRLEAGMVCEINLPERELALRICQAMVKDRELPVDDEVCRLIASQFGVHARQISGALNRLHMHYLMDNRPITLAVAENVLSDLLRLNRRDIRLQDVGKAVCEEFGLSEETLRSKSRVKQILAPRMLAMWLARKYTRSALSEIGVYFGNHSHSSVISAQRKVDRQICEDATLAELVQKIERALE
ncbi:MAG: DnaA/Hda family protein [Planctomycetaceae bacterium]|nr:DnaA/Hda family protein [Planctomycetaceae bacterium]